ncbi:2OG-Fe(II) oxygenase [Kangiella shandongensis]|uniref:2OG-Fe(II) oxygenase n=1 Tax=Kangiella shandongensis TaxID=2763258 RepID=UPI0038B37B28
MIDVSYLAGPRFGETPALFEKIAQDIGEQGYSINPNALPPELAQSLYQQLQQMPQAEFDSAGIGRQVDHMLNSFVRTDEICWIDGSSETGARWLEWTSALRRFLNARLLLGLFSFESHYAHYAPGDFYKRHFDAFKGESNRVLSLVIYLNPGWLPDDSGELVIYRDELDMEGTKVTPSFGTLVAFLSEEFPHEVLPAARDRYSIAGWYRLNTSHGQKVDPPR